MRLKAVVRTACAALVLVLIGCGPSVPGETGTEIVDAEEALALVNDGAILVDSRPMMNYREGHIAGAVNIGRADIVVNVPFQNMLAPAEQIEAVMGSRGIGNDDLVVAYDASGNMDAARLWWTLKIYGHDDVKVVSGGFDALTRAGAEVVTTAPTVTETSFRVGAFREEMVTTAPEIRSWINDPDPAMSLIDTRSEEEYLRDGSIPGAILLPYQGNNFADGTFRPERHIRIRYLEAGVDFDEGATLYCVTSIRGAQTYLAMYNAGYRNLKLYDGAWLDWTANPLNPIYRAEPATIQLDAADNS